MYGLYIHIPFCVKKCKYCDFVSFPNSEDMFGKYIDALLAEADEYAGVAADTVFIGGGTPTVLSAKQLERLISGIRKRFRLASDCEFTTEANPGTLTADKISALLSNGVNRISVGIQSFDDNELAAIGRIHSAKTAYDTVCELAKAGFKNINADIMTALPDQTWKSLGKTLETAVSLPLTHISAYSLIIEEGTPLEREYSRGEIILPDEDTDREMYAETIDFLAKRGFKQYEISNFSKNGFECRHNIKYWQCREYIGLGAAAHSYTDGKRFYNTSDLSDYIAGNCRAGGEEVLSKKDKISEFMIMGLRMTEGVSRKEFKRRFGKEIETVYGDELERFVSGGFMKKTGDNYALTRHGTDVSNSVLCMFV